MKIRGLFLLLLTLMTQSSLHLAPIEGCLLFSETPDSNGIKHCLRCEDGLYLRKDGLSCDKCVRECTRCQDTTCLSCLDGYFLFQNKCFSCGENCSKCTNSECAACKSGFGFDEYQRKCTKCHNSCQQCDGRGNCIKCPYKMVLKETEAKTIICVSDETVTEKGTNWWLIGFLIVLALLLICICVICCYKKKHPERVNLLGKKAPQQDHDHTNPFEDYQGNDDVQTNSFLMKQHNNSNILVDEKGSPQREGSFPFNISNAGNDFHDRRNFSQTSKPGPAHPSPNLTSFEASQIPPSLSPNYNPSIIPKLDKYKPRPDYTTRPEFILNPGPTRALPQSVSPDDEGQMADILRQYVEEYPRPTLIKGRE